MVRWPVQEKRSAEWFGRRSRFIAGTQGFRCQFQCAICPYVSRTHVEQILLRYIKNQEVAQVRLNALKELDRLSSMPTVLVLQSKMLHQPISSTIISRLASWSH